MLNGTLHCNINQTVIVVQMWYLNLLRTWLSCYWNALTVWLKWVCWYAILLHTGHIFILYTFWNCWLSNVILCSSCCLIHLIMLCFSSYKSLPVLCRIKDRESEFGAKCEEYERQIKHLRQLLREKDDESNLLESEKKWVITGFLVVVVVVVTWCCSYILNVYIFQSHLLLNFASITWLMFLRNNTVIWNTLRLFISPAEALAH